MPKSNKIIGLELLRIICAFIVVCFHTFTMSIDKIISPTPDSLLLRIFPPIIWLAVSMFLFLSGALLEIQIKKGKVKPSFGLVKSKAMRLCLPYCVFTIIFMINGWFFNWASFYNGDFWHLWFLPTVFWCILIFTVLRTTRLKFNILYYIGLLIFFLTLSCFEWHGNFKMFGLTGIIKWGFFFLLGMFIEQHKAQARDKLFKRHLWVVCLIAYTATVVLHPVAYMAVDIINYIAIGCMLPVIYLLFVRITFKLGKAAKIILTVGSCSLGIYILHYLFLIYLLSSTSIRIFGISGMTYSAIVGIMFVIATTAFLLSLISVKLIRKTPLKHLI